MPDFVDLALAIAHLRSTVLKRLLTCFALLNQPVIWQSIRVVNGIILYPHDLVFLPNFSSAPLFGVLATSLTYWLLVIRIFGMSRVLSYQAVCSIGGFVS